MLSNIFFFKCVTLAKVGFDLSLKHVPNLVFIFIFTIPDDEDVRSLKPVGLEMINVFILFFTRAMNSSINFLVWFHSAGELSAGKHECNCTYALLITTTEDGCQYQLPLTRWSAGFKIATFEIDTAI